MGLTVNISNRLLTHVHNKTSPIEQKVIKLWQFGEETPHAGQFLSSKRLPNGNTQKRIVTAYGNNNMLGIETNVYDKNNNLVKSYFGERGVKGTKAYASGSIKDINLIASNAQHFNPEMQTLNTYTYNYLA